MLIFVLANNILKCVIIVRGTPNLISYSQCLIYYLATTVFYRNYPLRNMRKKLIEHNAYPRITAHIRVPRQTQLPRISAHVLYRHPDQSNLCPDPFVTTCQPPCLVVPKVSDSHVVQNLPHAPIRAPPSAVHPDTDGVALMMSSIRPLFSPV
jgi:hypothetical protein